MTTRTNVTVADMLLFGAPDGKTEILDGFVDRIFVAKTTAQARAVFQGLARELAEAHGVVFDAKKVAVRGRLQSPRFRLFVEGRVVTLSVRAKVGVYAQFAGW